MKIRNKVLGILIGMACLVAVEGGLAIDRQHAAAIIGATKAAEELAHVLSFMVLPNADQFSPSAAQAAQELVMKLHHAQGRDIVLVDANKVILADAVPANVGQVFAHDTNDEVRATLRDHKPRTFVEVSEDYPEGIKQIAVSIQGESGNSVGAVIVEYTPLYNEMMKMEQRTLAQAGAAVMAAIVIAFISAFYMTVGITKPLEQLTAAASGFAHGQRNLPMPPPRSGEIGDLAAAFCEMVDRRQEAENALLVLKDDLEARVKERTVQLAQANEELHAEIAERKRGQETLRESEEKFNQLAHSISDVFWIISADLKSLHYVSPAYELVSGRSVESLLDEPERWNDAVLPQDRERFDAAFGTLLEQEKMNVEYRISRPDGEVRWVHTRGFPVRGTSGEVIRIAGVTSDITERKTAEAELERTHKMLLDASRLAGMAEVATDVLHNVGNVLNSVNVSASLVTQNVKKSKVANLGRVVGFLEEHESNLGAFVTNDPRGKGLPSYLRRLFEHLNCEQQALTAELQSLCENIDHIKDIVSMQQEHAKFAGVTEILDVSDLVEESLRMNAAALARHGIVVERDFQDIPPITIEKNKALQILVNLIRNAKFACDQVARADKRLRLRVASDEGRIKISVTDNGVGIPAENLTRIFNHGFTTRKDGHGFGLHSGALAAKEMGGTLSVHSEGSGSGATFTLELPASLSA